MWDAVVVFTTWSVAFSVTREITLPTQALDEDSGPGPVAFPRTDEIRARVTLTPLPPTTPSRESNLVRRGEPIAGGGAGVGCSRAAARRYVGVARMTHGRPYQLNVRRSASNAVSPRPGSMSSRLVRPL